MKYLKLYEHFSTRKTLVNLDEKVEILLFVDDNNLTFVLYDTNEEFMIGYISITYHSDIDTYSVDDVEANRGYGALLYELAMTKCGNKGLTCSQEDVPTDDAINVWKKFYNREDVKKEDIKRNKESLLNEFIYDDFDCGDGDIECKKYIETILKYHSTRFVYSLDKEIFNNLIEKGNKYKIANSIKIEELFEN